MSVLDELARRLQERYRQLEAYRWPVLKGNANAETAFLGAQSELVRTQAVIEELRQWPELPDLEGPRRAAEPVKVERWTHYHGERRAERDGGRHLYREVCPPHLPYPYPCATCGRTFWSGWLEVDTPYEHCAGCIDTSEAEYVPWDEWKALQEERREKAERL